MEVMIVNNQNHNHNQQSSLFREALASSSIGWEIALPIGGGVLLGQVIDKMVGTTIVFTILFLLLGVFSGFYNLVRHVQRINAQKTITKGRPISDEEWDAWDEEWEDEYDENTEEEEV
jgi:ATP synthase protein I